MDTEKNWLALEITIDAAAAEAIESAFNELDALGTEIDSLGKAKSRTVCVVGYFNEKPDDAILQAELTEALRIYDFPPDAIKKTAWRAIENTDWLAEWKKHWRPTRVGKFIVAPTWSAIETSENPQNRETIIRIDPEMAFGTGTHETTKLCLRAIEENYTNEMSFFDVGTGTGILAIAAAKIHSEFQIPNSRSGLNDFPSTLDSRLLNPNSIVACDTDENSIEIARKNAVLNNVGEDVDFYVGSIQADTPIFDFVCANLTADVILPILPLLVEKARRKLILSGILREQESLITEELRRLEISDFKVRTDGEWISVLVDNG